MVCFLSPPDKMVQKIIQKMVPKIVQSMFYPMPRGTVRTEVQKNRRHRGPEEQWVQGTSGTVGTEEQ